MPYIDGDTQMELDAPDCGRVPETPGELNYKITNEVLEYLDRKQAVNYAALNEVIGVLECAKLEFYRRAASPYENDKAMLNGDIYEHLS